MMNETSIATVNAQKNRQISQAYRQVSVAVAGFKRELKRKLIEAHIKGQNVYTLDGKLKNRMKALLTAVSNLINIISSGRVRSIDRDNIAYLQNSLIRPVQQILDKGFINEGLVNNIKLREVLIA